MKGADRFPCPHLFAVLLRSDTHPRARERGTSRPAAVWCGIFDHKVVVKISGGQHGLGSGPELGPEVARGPELAPRGWSGAGNPKASAGREEAAAEAARMRAQLSAEMLVLKVRPV